MLFVYRNLRNKIFSIRKNGLVIARGHSFLLCDCTFKVSEAGRQRVLKEKRKNVHAGVTGTSHIDILDPLSQWVEITYNPYKAGYFYRKNDTATNPAPVYRADYVRFSYPQIFALNPQ